MPKYLVRASYTVDGVQGVMKEGGTSRREAVGKLISGLGGTMESFYFAFGDDDVYVLADLPDNATAASIALSVGSTGAVRTRSVVLLSPEEIDEAIAKSVDYRPPGA
jgi:uncharacterized protein with GYD domain